MPKTPKGKPPLHRFRSHVEAIAERKRQSEEAHRLPAHGAAYPHPLSGTMHSCAINEGHRLYYQRHFRQRNQKGRCFSWSFFIARHSGGAMKDIDRLKECVIPHWESRQNGIVLHVRGRTSEWMEGHASNLAAGSRVRLTLRTGPTGAKEEFEFVFPPDPDTQNGLPVRMLEYNGEDINDI